MTDFSSPVGTSGIILQAPTLYDTRPAIDEDISKIIPTWKQSTGQMWTTDTCVGIIK